jgi:hypothetical protein
VHYLRKTRAVWRGTASFLLTPSLRKQTQSKKTVTG